MVESLPTKEIVHYPNGGKSYFYVINQTAIIIDEGICNCNSEKDIFPYTLVTDKQNDYMHWYEKVYRFLAENMETIEDVIRNTKANSEMDFKIRVANREDNGTASPLELLFEESFAKVYGMKALNYLSKEYGIVDTDGHNYFLDYFVKLGNGGIAVEENGVSYHHPQIIGVEKYRRQLRKQNTCTQWGIKLYRFSTEDCQFENRIQDDIRIFFGSDVSKFQENGLLIDRRVKLYDHQEATLQDIERKRAEGVFGSYKTGLSLIQAMEEGIVAQANVYRIETNIDLSQVRFNGKDYVNADLEKSIRVTSRNELIVNVLKEYFCDGEMANRQGIIFCVNTKHTVEMEKLLNTAGISAKSYTGQTKNADKVKQDFKEKKIRFLCACNMISEGWDYPDVINIREELNIPEHTEETIKQDFFDFLEERDYSLSYKMPFLLSFLKNMNSIGDANIEEVLNDYTAFYEDRIKRGLPVDRPSCPYNAETLKDRKLIKANMLTNPFEKFERKRFLYHSKDLGVISMNHALFSRMDEMDFERVKEQMLEDIKNYYRDMGV